MEWYPTITLATLTALALVARVGGVCFLWFRDKRKEMVLGIMSLTFTIVLAEAFLRLFAPQIMEHDKMFSYDPSLGWKFVENRGGYILYPGEARHYIKINSLGFRGALPPADTRIRRILVLGDSFVTNLSVRDDEVFTEVMSQQLTGTAVLNFGVNGYGQVQEYLLLKEWLHQIRPDVVVVVIYVRNDFEDNVGGDWLYPRPVAFWNRRESTLQIHPPPPARPASTPYWRFYRGSHVFHLLDRGLYTLMDNMPRRSGSYRPSRFTPPELYLCRLDVSEETEAMYRTMEELLLTIAGYLREKRVPLVFVIAPSVVQVEEGLWSVTLSQHGEEEGNYVRSLPNERLGQFAIRNDLLMIDLLPILEAAARSGRTVYNRAEQHWNSEGNRLVADSLVTYLRSKALVE